MRTYLRSTEGGGIRLVVDFDGVGDDVDLAVEIDSAVRSAHLPPGVIDVWDELCAAGHAPVPDETALLAPGRAEWTIE